MDLDQSLDSIIAAKPKVQRKKKPSAAGKSTAGVRKATVAKKSTQDVVKKAISALVGGEPTKIIVSNLPTDVTEAQCKDYFSSTIGQVKKCEYAYGPTGNSKGIATIIFVKPGAARKAATELNGRLIDGSKKMKVEMVFEPKAPSLADRVQPAKKAGAASGKTAGKSTGTTKQVRDKASSKKDDGAKKGKKGPKRTKKTAEELDAEMTDYFEKK